MKEKVIDIPINDLISEFLVNQDIRENSREKYRQNLHRFRDYMVKAGVNVKQPKKADIIDYKHYLIGLGKKDRTVESYLAAVKLFFKYLEEIEIYPNVSLGVKLPPRKKKYTKKHLQPDQIRALLTQIDLSERNGRRDFALVNLMCQTGMRCIEVSRMDINDISQVGKRWRIKLQGKGHNEKDREITVFSDVMDPIFSYLSWRGVEDPKDPVFVTNSGVSSGNRCSPVIISRLIKSRLRKAGIDDPEITAHSLRHTAAINAYKQGVSVFDIMLNLGHTSVKTTQIYLESLELTDVNHDAFAQANEDFIRKAIKPAEKSLKKASVLQQ